MLINPYLSFINEKWKNYSPHNFSDKKNDEESSDQ
jgi:hypothetical protein